jgi:multiple antibiotic resistance protein
MLESIIARTRTTPAETEEGLEHDDIAISPIGIPIVTGPGAITAVMVLAGETDGAQEQILLLLSITFVMLVTLTVFLTAPKIFKRLGKSGARLIQRLMGMILMVIAVQFIIDGISNVIGIILLDIKS